MQTPFSAPQNKQENFIENDFLARFNKGLLLEDVNNK